MNQILIYEFSDDEDYPQFAATITIISTETTKLLSGTNDYKIFYKQGE
jgi:hypothetical protein